jgi:hypothetical protein
VLTLKVKRGREKLEKNPVNDLSYDDCGLRWCGSQVT